MYLNLFVFLVFILEVYCLSEPNPPYFPSSVYIFDPSNSGHAQSVVDQAFATNGGSSPVFNGQFNSQRYAFLFLPGTHNVNVNVGFYTTVIGLGAKPTDTTIKSVKVADGDNDYTGGALCNFWRSAENFATGYTLWAVSQASPLRRVHVNGNMDLFQYTGGCCAGYASGGFLADSVVTGNINSGSQQQFFTRNTNMGKWDGSVWNMVHVGNTGGVPGSHCGNTGGGPFVTVGSAPVIAEKPYLVVRNNKFYLRIPKVETNKAGPTTNFDNVDEVDFSNVYVSNSSDSAAIINAKISQGLHVILTPGLYHLTEPIHINKANIAVVGIGMPTLIAANGNPLITVGNVDGVRISGVLLQAGFKRSSSLLQWGEQGYAGNAQNPGFLYDIFTRIGGPDDQGKGQVAADVNLIINSGHVVIDDAWLWRADHTVSGEVKNSDNPSYNGIVVNGDNVVSYGLAVEHHLHDGLVWNGNGGKVYFFQCELPYDVTQQNFGNPGYAGYVVANGVSSHQAWGVGIYTFFRDASVTVESGIKAPSGGGISFVSPFARFLSGNGGITHVINNKGAAINAQSTLSYVC